MEPLREGDGPGPKPGYDYVELIRNLNSLARSRLRLGTRYGKLLVGRESRKGQQHGRQYLCQCDCGAKVFLTPFELHLRKALNEGCASEDCTEATSMSKRWLNLEYSLRLQWGFHLYRTPTRVQHSWGGQIGSRIVLSEKECFARFFRYARDLTNSREGKIWIRKIHSHLPFMEGNLRATRRYSVGVFTKPWLQMSDGLQFYTYEDMAARVGCNLQHLLQVRSQHKFSDEAFMALMGLKIE